LRLNRAAFREDLRKIAVGVLLASFVGGWLQELVPPGVATAGAILGAVAWVVGLLEPRED
jgi:hypothetical protein